MNAPTYINSTHRALARNPGGLTLEEIAGKIRAKAKKAAEQVRELHDLGMIQTTEEAGQPVYKLDEAAAVTEIPAPEYDPKSVAFPAASETRIRVMEGKQAVAEVGDTDVVELERVLTPEAQAERDDFVANYGFDGNCFCHTGEAPCASCMHPGNPLQQDEDESCWMTVSDSEGGEADAPAIAPAIMAAITEDARNEQAADADGWIPWVATADSVCPVPEGTKIRARLEDGSETPADETEIAELLIWSDMSMASIVAYKIIAQAPADFATTPELQYLAPEDYDMPPADPAMLAAANRALGEQLDAVKAELEIERGRLAACGVVAMCDTPESAKKARDVRQEYRSASCDDVARRVDECMALRTERDDLRARLDAAREWERLWEQKMKEATGEDGPDDVAAVVAKLRAELATERQARKALQEQAGEDAVDVKDAAVGYLVRVPKRTPILRRKPESARSAALSAVRAGAARAEVLAVVPVGTARRGAEWRVA